MNYEAIVRIGETEATVSGDGSFEISTLLGRVLGAPNIDLSGVIVANNPDNNLVTLHVGFRLGSNTPLLQATITITAMR